MKWVKVPTTKTRRKLIEENTIVSNRFEYHFIGEYLVTVYESVRL